MGFINYVQYNDILQKLKALSNPGVAAEMARYGINSKNTLGVSMPDMRIIAGEAGRDHSLARQLWSQGEKDAAKIRRQMVDLIQKEPLSTIHYVSIADDETLKELDTVKPLALVSMAVKIGKTRLIDNVVLG